MSDRPLVSYEPNPLLAWFYERFFSHIRVDEAWAEAVREADSRGTVVYVLRNLSFIDFFALDHLTKRLHLPQVQFANDLGLSVLEPMGRGWLSALDRSRRNDVGDLRRALTQGSSAALFLKRPPGLLDPHPRGQTEGDPFIRTILEVQRRSERPILLVPQVFVWSRHADDARPGIIDSVFGPREWPGKLRTIAQFMANYRHVTLRAGEPVDVRTFLAQAATNEQSSDDVLVRRLMYTLLRRLERERRAVIGPAKKSAERLREEVVRSPKLQKIIHDMAGEGAADQRVIAERADGMVREMESALNMNAIGAIDVALDNVLRRIYSSEEIDEEGIERLRAAAKDGTIVLLPSHKSHIDYLLLSRVFFRHHMQVPIVAAGDNLAFFPLGPVFRRAGAFFIRRSFHGDRLYGAVVDAYLRRLLLDGFSVEFFLEGGRSRTGKLLSPKLGLLSIVVDAALGLSSRKVYFCPISIGYERVVEEKAYVREVSGAEKKKEDVRGLFASAEAVIGHFGRVSVQFGELLTLERVLREYDPEAADDALTKLTPAKRRGLVTRLAYRVMNEINRVTAVTAGSLVATALLTHEHRGLSHAELVATCEQLARILKTFGARFSPSLRDLRGAVDEACELFVRAGHVEKKRAAAYGDASGEAFYTVPEEARMSLDLSKNLVVHFFVSRALVATALLTSISRSVDVVRERVLTLSRLFKFEFQFRADATFDQIFDETLASMIEIGELIRDGDDLVVSSGDAGANVMLYAQIVRNFVEGYRVAARGLAPLLKGAMTPKDLSKRAIATGQRMYLGGEVTRREAISGPVIENAYHAFTDQGYLSRSDGKLTLTESYASVETLRTVEAKIAAFVLPRA